MQAQPKKPVPPPEFRAEKIDAADEPALIRLLESGTEFEKAKACQRLAVIGTSAATPALGALLTDPKLATYARYGLEPLPGTAADDVLRASLRKVKGPLLIGVINSIGKRRDPKAAPALARLLHDPDVAVAQAAAAALGRISGVDAARTLQVALGRSKGPVRTAIADAGLLCAEALLERGNRSEAMTMYNALVAPDVPKPVRLAAMQGIIAAENSLSRPREAVR